MDKAAGEVLIGQIMAIGKNKKRSAVWPSVIGAALMEAADSEEDDMEDSKECENCGGEVCKECNKCKDCGKSCETEEMED